MHKASLELVSVYETARLPSVSEVGGGQDVAVVAERWREVLVEEELEERAADVGLGASLMRWVIWRAETLLFCSGENWCGQRDGDTGEVRSESAGRGKDGEQERQQCHLEMGCETGQWRLV